MELHVLCSPTTAISGRLSNGRQVERMPLMMQHVQLNACHLGERGSRFAECEEWKLMFNIFYRVYRVFNFVANQKYCWLVQHMFFSTSFSLVKANKTWWKLSPVKRCAAELAAQAAKGEGQVATDGLEPRIVMFSYLSDESTIKINRSDRSFLYKHHEIVFPFFSNKHCLVGTSQVNLHIFIRQTLPSILASELSKGLRGTSKTPPRPCWHSPPSIPETTHSPANPERHRSTTKTWGNFYFMTPKHEIIIDNCNFWLFHERRRVVSAEIGMHVYRTQIDWYKPPRLMKQLPGWLCWRVKPAVTAFQWMHRSAETFPMCAAVFWNEFHIRNMILILTGPADILEQLETWNHFPHLEASKPSLITGCRLSQVYLEGCPAVSAFKLEAGDRVLCYWQMAPLCSLAPGDQAMLSWHDLQL